MPRDTLERITGIVFLASFIAAQFLAGIVAALRVAGVACLVTALVWVIERSVPVGIEGRPPSFYLRGAGAVIAAILMGALGVSLLVYSRQAACFIGWVTGETCQ